MAVTREVVAQLLEVRAAEQVRARSAAPVRGRVVECDEFVEMPAGGVMLDDDAFALGLRDLVTVRLTHSRADRREVVVEIDRNGLAVIDEQAEFFERKRRRVDALSNGCNRIRNAHDRFSREHFAKRSGELAPLLRRRQLVTPPQPRPSTPYGLIASNRSDLPGTGRRNSGTEQAAAQRPRAIRPAPVRAGPRRRVRIWDGRVRIWDGRVRIWDGRVCIWDGDVVPRFGEHADATTRDRQPIAGAPSPRSAPPVRCRRAYSIDRVGRAGRPTAIVCGGMSWATSPPPPTIEYSPIFVPGSIVAPMPSCANGTNRTVTAERRVRRDMRKRPDGAVVLDHRGTC